MLSRTEVSYINTQNVKTQNLLEISSLISLPEGIRNVKQRRISSCNITSQYCVDYAVVCRTVGTVTQQSSNTCMWVVCWSSVAAAMVWYGMVWYIMYIILYNCVGCQWMIHVALPWSVSWTLCAMSGTTSVAFITSYYIKNIACPSSSFYYLCGCLLLIHDNLLTYSMEQSPSWEAKWFCS